MVCSNSFRSDDHQTNAVGLLHDEMRRTGSIMMEMAAKHAVPAGSALAVDREGFSTAVTERLLAHPLLSLERGEIAGLPPAVRDRVVIAPIVYADSIDMEKAWFQSRYDKGETEAERTAYLNCPMDRDQYETFIDALITAPKTEFKEWEKDTPYFEGCLPIEVMAERGRETLRFGPL